MRVYHVELCRKTRIRRSNRASEGWSAIIAMDGEAGVEEAIGMIVELDVKDDRGRRGRRNGLSRFGSPGAAAQGLIDAVRTHLTH